MNFKISFLYLAIGSLLLCEKTLYTLDIVVMSENDSGVGTLRQAISDINSSGSGTNTITFAPNINTISLLTPLPKIENSVTINGFGPAINCDQLSPVTNPEEFSAAITVTVDGIYLPITSSIPLFGLLICADNVVIRGLRIAHFSNIEDAQVAGIVTDGNNTLIECCEIRNLNGNNSNTLATVTGIYEINRNSTPTCTISKCFVHNLYTLNRTAVETITQTGAIIGIGFFAIARDCRVENLTSGSITYKNPIATPPQLKTGVVIGIRDTSNSDELCNLKKQCEAPDNCQGSECILADNCVVACCKTGSISATKEANVIIGSAVGINMEPEITPGIIINRCNVCDISTGNALLSDATFSLVLENTFGVNASSSTTYLCNNNISRIYRGEVTLGGLNSSATLGFVIGTFSGLGTIIAENNTCSDVNCQAVSSSGLCSTTIDDQSPIPAPLCFGNLLTPITLSTPICAGMWFQADTIHTSNNTITSISAGKRTALGEQSLIVSGYASGIFANAFQEIVAKNNTIRNIFGAKLVAGSTARGVFGGIGSRGIALWSVGFDGAEFTIIAEKNTVEQVCEQTLQVAHNVPGGYIFVENLDENQTEILKPVAQTIGISIKTDQDLISVFKKIIINNNMVKDIAGATITGNTLEFGTMAVGIAVEAPVKLLVARRQQQELCTLFNTAIREEPSKISNNQICNIWSGTKNTAYGILLDGTNSALQRINDDNELAPLFFSIANNTITNVTGLGIPQPFGAPLLSLDGCGTLDQNSITFVPFPYQPTSGIYSIFGNCVTIDGNTISNITEPSKNAGGITTQASSDVDITGNIISKINGYGIFVGGATAKIDFINENGFFTEEQFEEFFASARNKIFSNSTYNNTKQGIELGLIDWNNYFQVSESQCGSVGDSLRTHQEIPEDSVTIFGNHGQPKPYICDIRINRNGSISAKFIFDSPDQPLTKFIIQFFASKTNSIPHGEQHISDFNDPVCIFKTDINGHAKTIITFIPVAFANSNDIFSAHVTVAASGQSSTVPSNSKGDTSEFSTNTQTECLLLGLTQKPNKAPQLGFANLLYRIPKQ